MKNIYTVSLLLSLVFGASCVYTKEMSSPEKLSEKINIFEKKYKDFLREYGTYETSKAKLYRSNENGKVDDKYIKYFLASGLDYNLQLTYRKNNSGPWAEFFAFYEKLVQANPDREVSYADICQSFDVTTKGLLSLITEEGELNEQSF